ncbi:type VI secretion system ATPase TssH, partial [Vibrio sp. D173a]|nr:type VI secretion system ATPase TssH [Vibrio sp. D173a]
EAAVSLSIRYLPSRQLPDKAFSLLDTACARIALTQGAKPECIESLEQNISYLESERSALEAEGAVFIDKAVDHEGLNQKIDQQKGELNTLNERWEKERELVATITTLCETIESSRLEDNVDTESQAQLNIALGQLKEIQGELPLVFPVVDDQVIATVIENWTGIPAGNMVQEEVAQLLSLDKAL